MRDLWTKEQFNLTSANLVAAKKAVTALCKKAKGGIKMSGKFQLQEKFYVQIKDNNDRHR